MQSADKEGMEHHFQQMDCAERERHHDQLLDEGYEWCPDCGTVLVWELAPRAKQTNGRYLTTAIAGDYPPITRDDLEATAPAPY